MSRSFGSQLTRDAVTYGIAGGASQLTAILLVPIYARVLGPSGVGVVGVLQSTISLSLVLVGLAWPQAFLRWYLREHAHDRSDVLAVTMTIRLAASAVGLAIILLAVIPLTELLYDGDHLGLFALAAPIVVLDSLNAIPLTYFRAERRPKSYLLIAVARSVLGAVLIVVFVVGVSLGLIGVGLGMAAAAAATTLVAMGLLLRSTTMRLSFNRQLAASMLRFAAPLIPAAAGIWILNLSDRPILQAVTGSTELVGVYTVGYTAGMVLSALVVQPFSLAWGAAHWQLGTDAPRQFARVMTSFLGIAAAVAVGLSALGTDAIRLLFGPAFENSRYIVPFSAFGFVFYGAHVIAFTGLTVTGRTSRAALALAVAAVVSVTLNLLLIPPLGIIGAGVSTVVGYLSLAVLTAGVSHRHYPVPWEVARGTTIIGFAAVLSVAAVVGPDSPVWRIGCALAYLVVLAVTIRQAGNPIGK